MKVEWNEVLSAALALPAESRQRLIDELATSLDDDDDPELTPEMVAELKRREAAMRRGDKMDIETFLSRVRR